MYIYIYIYILYIIIHNYIYNIIIYWCIIYIYQKLTCDISWRMCLDPWRQWVQSMGLANFHDQSMAMDRQVCTWHKMFRTPTSLVISSSGDLGMAWFLWCFFRLKHVAKFAVIVTLPWSIESRVIIWLYSYIYIYYLLSSTSTSSIEPTRCMACSDNVVRGGLTPKFKDAVDIGIQGSPMGTVGANSITKIILFHWYLLYQ